VDVLLDTEAGAILLASGSVASNGTISVFYFLVPPSFQIPITIDQRSKTLIVPVRLAQPYELTVVDETTAAGASMRVEFNTSNEPGQLAMTEVTHKLPTSPPCPVATTYTYPSLALPGPLVTSGRWIVESQNHKQRIKLASVNWYGAEEADFVPGGLDCQSIGTIAAEIAKDRFNSVRLPWSNAMLEEDPSLCSDATFDEPCIDPAFLKANPQLETSDPDAMGVYTAVVQALAQQGLMVVLDDHTTDAQFAPSAGNGVWWGGQIWADYFSCSTSQPSCDWPARDHVWEGDWLRMVGLLDGYSNVIGVDLRNEPNNDNSYGQELTWSSGDGPSEDNWRSNAEWVGKAILAKDPNLLIMVEGTDYSNDLTGVSSSSLNLPGHVVYSPHSYARDTFDSPFGQKYGQLSYPQLATALGQAWGFILKTAPVWVGEFGVCNTPTGCTSTQTDFLNNFAEYLASNDADWSYWAFNGTDSNGGNGGLGRARFDDETYGILNETWIGPQTNDLLTVLQGIQGCHQGPGCG